MGCTSSTLKGTADNGAVETAKPKRHRFSTKPPPPNDEEMERVLGMNRQQLTEWGMKRENQARVNGTMKANAHDHVIGGSMVGFGMCAGGGFGGMGG